MKIELNIEQTVQDAIAAALAPEVITAKVTELVSGTLDKVLADQFKSYGEFGKAIESGIKALVPHSLDIQGPANFYHALGQAISTRLAVYQNAEMERFVKPMLDELLQLPPKSIRLSDLLKQAVETWGNDWQSKGSDCPTLIVTPTEFGSRWVYMDPKQGQDRYQCRISFLVNDERGEASALKVEGQDIKTTLFAGSFWRFERLLFAMYCGGTKFEVDDVDTDSYEFNYPHRCEC